MTLTYDEALRDQIRGHLAGHDRRAVADPTKRHAAVAVVLVDSETGEDRVDPAPVDDWIGNCCVGSLARLKTPSGVAISLILQLRINRFDLRSVCQKCVDAFRVEMLAAL